MARAHRLGGRSRCRTPTRFDEGKLRRVNGGWNGEGLLLILFAQSDQRILKQSTPMRDVRGAWILRLWYRGCARGFHPREAGSNPVSRSIKIVPALVTHVRMNVAAYPMARCASSIWQRLLLLTIARNLQTNFCQPLGQVGSFSFTRKAGPKLVAIC